MDFTQFGYRTDMTRDPLPMFTYRVLSRIPDFVPLGGIMLGGVWWITHRRADVAALKGKKPESQAREEEKRS